MYMLIGKDSELETFSKKIVYFILYGNHMLVLKKKKKNLNVCSTDSKVITPDIF